MPSLRYSSLTILSLRIEQEGSEYDIISITKQKVVYRVLERNNGNIGSDSKWARRAPKRLAAQYRETGRATQ